jgi:hypothetical protein
VEKNLQITRFLQVPLAERDFRAKLEPKPARPLNGVTLPRSQGCDLDANDWLSCSDELRWLERTDGRTEIVESGFSSTGSFAAHLARTRSAQWDLFFRADLKTAFRQVSFLLASGSPQKSNHRTSCEPFSNQKRILEDAAETLSCIAGHF